MRVAQADSSSKGWHLFRSRTVLGQSTEQRNFFDTPPAALPAAQNETHQRPCKIEHSCGHSDFQPEHKPAWNLAQRPFLSGLALDGSLHPAPQITDETASLWTVQSASSTTSLSLQSLAHPQAHQLVQGSAQKSRGFETSYKTHLGRPLGPGVRQWRSGTDPHS